jgi:hypothetical protein
MNWEKLDLHIENLIPGVVLITIVILAWPISLTVLSGHEGLLLAAFVGAAYMLGAIGNVLARLLLEFVVRNTIRSYFVRFFLGDRIEIDNSSRSAINKRFSAIITAGLSCGSNIVETEVAKRRQTGRMVRSALLPAILAATAFGQHAKWGILKSVLAAIVTYAAVLLVYAYAEVVTCQEAYRGEQIKKATEKSK